ncbi:hypothetical protein NDU88_003871 [Pleurodeles waltl]|uniref:Uncharacterized protein n=1 Tax=Pleurodeles waltl TaxID=8319 RepID=A0AAV7SH62_PLEWA|nr:hypothetical protein NDU88_003871 [Pleurodeles waltl]
MLGLPTLDEAGASSHQESSTSDLLKLTWDTMERSHPDRSWAAPFSKDPKRDIIQHLRNMNNPPSPLPSGVGYAGKDCRSDV